MKKLYLMRHAETLFNQLGKIQGACDSPLTPKGIEQAKQTNIYLNHQNLLFDSYYCSTQERASDTLELATNQTNYQRIKGLKEWNFGQFEGESERLNPKIKAGETSYGDYFVDYGGESSQEVQNRMNQALTSIMNNNNHSPLVVSHGGAIYLFSQKWMNFQDVTQLKFSNCAILVFSFKNNQFYFEERIDPLI